MNIALITVTILFMLTYLIIGVYNREYWFVIFNMAKNRNFQGVAETFKKSIQNSSLL